MREILTRRLWCVLNLGKKFPKLIATSEGYLLNITCEGFSFSFLKKKTDHDWDYLGSLLANFSHFLVSSSCINHQRHWALARLFCVELAFRWILMSLKCRVQPLIRQFCPVLESKLWILTLVTCSLITASTTHLWCVWLSCNSCMPASCET